MTAALMLSIGSRGDAEPLFSLATKLLCHFDTVHVLHQPDYSSHIPRHPRIVAHQLPFGMKEFISVSRRQLFISLIQAFFTGFDTVKIQMQCISQIVTQIVVPATAMLLDLAEEIDPSVVISTTLGMSVAATIAEKKAVPFCLFNFQPNTPTAAYPYYMHGTENALLAAEEVAKMHKFLPSNHSKGEEYSCTYNAQYNLFVPSLPQLNLIRESSGMQEMSESQIEDIICGRTSNAHVINSFSKSIIPRSPDQLENVHVVPPLAHAYLPEEWNASESCPEIVEFLSKGEKPVCVTFGSMGPDLPNASVSRELFSGLRAAGVERVLVLNGTSDLGVHNLWRFRDGDLIDWAEKHIFVTKRNPQYAWLFPLCKAVVCHGGAGTTFAALRAGVPVVISPVICDQFFWGRLFERLQLGAMAGPELKSAHRDSFELAMKRSSELKVLETVQRFGDIERNSEDGSAIASNLINSLVQNDTA